MVSQEIINIIKRFIDRVNKAGIKTEKVFIFGSYARGNENKWSDIDLAIVSADFKKNHEWGAKLLKLAWEVDSRLEPIPFDAQSFEKDNWIPLVYEIKKHGIPVEFAA